VKTGRFKASAISAYFSTHLCDLVNRLGIWPNDENSRIVQAFQTERTHYDEIARVKLSKIAVVSTNHDRTSEDPWHAISLETAVRFIKQRMLAYAPEKLNARMMFPSSIIQYMADQAHASSPGRRKQHKTMKPPTKMLSDTPRSRK